MAPIRAKRGVRPSLSRRRSALISGVTLDTLPERLALAKSRSLPHAEFLELVLADEVTRRDTSSAALRARTAGLDPDMRLENWDNTAAVTYDHATFDELCSLRFVDATHNVVIMGPVGVGKTFLATALGHVVVTAFIASEPANFSSGSRHLASTTVTRSSCASCCVSIS